MNYRSWKRVKKIRVVLSLVLLALFTVLFVDAWHLVPPKVAAALGSVQFVPSLLKFIVAGSATAAAGLFFVVTLTLLFGRIYCSTICPLGVLQDILISASKMLDRRKRFRYSGSTAWLQYSILAVSVLLLVLGSGLMLGDLLEPFSNYGRIVNGFALPAVVAVNNAAAGLLGRIGVYWLYDIHLHSQGLVPLLLGGLFLVTLAYTSAAAGRLFCNSFCPAGALLSLLSRFSFYRLAIVRESCNDCGACDRVCKSECIDSRSKTIDFSACIGCFNCLSSCPKDAIQYERRIAPGLGSAGVPYDAGRRAVLKNVTIPAVTLLAAPGLVKGGSSVEVRNAPITPPGSLGIQHFTSTCTACHLCVTSCPTNVLQPSFIEYGLTGMFQPRMDYSVNYCNYDCVICGEVCPTGAIIPLDVPAKKLVQIGKSTFNKDDCVVVSKKKDCAACSEHCPTKAVHTIPYENGLFLPEIDNELCIGCGACEHACPVTPKKAIAVIANPIHLKAKKPAVELPKEPSKASGGDFPF